MLNGIMQNRIFVPGALLLASFGLGQAQTFVVGAGGTEGRQVVVVDSSTPAEDFSGTSRALSGVITFDSETRDGSGFLVLDATTIDTGSRGRDRNMRSARWMNFDAYPEIRLDITSVTPTDGDSYEVAGSLAMSGEVAPLTATAVVRLLPESEQTRAAGFEGDILSVRSDFVVRLSDYGIDNTAYGSDSIANELELSVTLFGSNASD